MSGPGRAAVAGGSQGDGSRSVVVRVGARLGSIIKWSQGPLPIVRNLERLAGAGVFGDGSYLGGHFRVDGAGKGEWELGARNFSSRRARPGRAGFFPSRT